MNDTAHATEEAHGAQNYDDDQKPFLDATDLARRRDGGDWRRPFPRAVRYQKSTCRGHENYACAAAVSRININGSEVESSLECSAYGIGRAMRKRGALLKKNAGDCQNRACNRLMGR